MRNTGIEEGKRIERGSEGEVCVGEDAKGRNGRNGRREASFREQKSEPAWATLINIPVDTGSPTFEAPPVIETERCSSRIMC